MELGAEKHLISDKVQMNVACDGTRTQLKPYLTRYKYE